MKVSERFQLEMLRQDKGGGSRGSRGWRGSSGWSIVHHLPVDCTELGSLVALWGVFGDLGQRFSIKVQKKHARLLREVVFNYLRLQKVEPTKQVY